MLPYMLHAAAIVHSWAILMLATQQYIHLQNGCCTAVHPSTEWLLSSERLKKGVIINRMPLCSETEQEPDGAIVRSIERPHACKFPR